MFSLRSKLISFRKFNVRFPPRSFVATSFGATSGETFDNENSSIWPRILETSDDLVDFIRRNVIWTSDDYIVSVKPYKMSAFGRRMTWKKMMKERRSESGQESPFDSWDETELDGGVDDKADDADLTVSSVLPELGRIFFAEKLIISKSAPGKYEGPLVLSKSEKADLAVQDALVRAYRRLPYHQKILYICVGKPKLPEGEGWCYSKMEYNAKRDLYQFALDETCPSKRKIRRNLAKRGYFRYRVLAYDEESDCSLVEMEVRKISFHLDRLFLLDKGCPVLGDEVYQKCNARILGQSIYVSPLNASIKNQYIPTGLLKKFRISLKEYHELPMFAHVHTLTLPGLVRLSRKSRQDVELRIRTPSYFLAALRIFGWFDLVKEDEKMNQQVSDTKETSTNAT